MFQFKKLAPFFKKYWYKYMIGVVLIIIVDVLQLCIPPILGNLTEDIKKAGTDITIAGKYAIVILLIAIVMAALKYIWRVYIMGTSRLLETYLRNNLFSHLQTLSQSFFNSHKTGDLMAYATNDIGLVQQMFSQGIVYLVDFVVITFISMFMMIFTCNLKLTLAVLAPMVVLIIIILKFVKDMHQRFKESQEAFGMLSDCVQENFSGIRVVKSFVQENLELQKFTRINENNMNKNMRVARMWSLAFPVVMFFASLSFIITLVYGGMLVIHEEITLGHFISFNGFLGLLIWPMMALGWVVGLVERGSASMGRLNVLMDEKPEIFDAAHVKAVENVNGKIEIKHLTFAYPGHDTPVLKDISLTIEPGKTLAIVGKTGSGKSTLVNLLVRVYNVDRGQVFLDGTDIHDVPISVLRGSTGCVPQENYLFSTTVKANIDFFSGASMEKIEEAARSAHVYEDIQGFPKQFNTVLGERGVSLSGGQKQRIAIARALVRDPKILILDDSLSAVDAQTEERIVKNLQAFMEDRTSIIISHRISTVKYADQIIVMDEGCIAEKGTHEELLALGGVYEDMYRKQLLEDKIEHEE